MADRKRRPDQHPQTRLRLGPQPPRHPRRSPDLDRTRSPGPQPDQDQHPGQLTAAPRHPSRMSAAISPIATLTCSGTASELVSNSVLWYFLVTAVPVLGRLWRTPNTYLTAGLGRGTATSNSTRVGTTSSRAQGCASRITLLRPGTPTQSVQSLPGSFSAAPRLLPLRTSTSPWRSGQMRAPLSRQSRTINTITLVTPGLGGG